MLNFQKFPTIRYHPAKRRLNDCRIELSRKMVTSCNTQLVQFILHYRTLESYVPIQFMYSDSEFVQISEISDKIHFDIL